MLQTVGTMKAPLVSYALSDSESSENDSVQNKADTDETIAQHVLEAVINLTCTLLRADNNSCYILDNHGEYNTFRPRRISTCSSASEESSSAESSTSASTVEELTGLSGEEGEDAMFERICCAATRQRNYQNSSRPKNKSNSAPLNKGELTLEDLPKLENLHITVPENVKFNHLGTVGSIVDCLVIIKSKVEAPALDEDTIVFNSERKPIGKVFETFGQVTRPMYSIRFNGPEQIKETGVKVGDEIMFAENINEFTKRVFTDELRKMKGTDASWGEYHDNLFEEIDFSDDEEEKRYLAKQRQKGGPCSSAPLSTPTKKRRVPPKPRDEPRSPSLRGNHNIYKPFHQGRRGGNAHYLHSPGPYNSPRPHQFHQRSFGGSPSPFCYARPPSPFHNTVPRAEMQWPRQWNFNHGHGFFTSGQESWNPLVPPPPPPESPYNPGDSQ